MADPAAAGCHKIHGQVQSGLKGPTKERAEQRMHAAALNARREPEILPLMQALHQHISETLANGSVHRPWPSDSAFG